jgi:fructose-bisphosphate aldolase class II
MPLVTTTEILTDARKRRYGIPCFLGGTLEMTIGAVKAAEELSAPLILCFNEPITPDIPAFYGMTMIVNAAQHAKVPVATTLDHGTSYEACVRSVRAGSSSIMFDGSFLPFEENVQQTKRVRELTKPIGVALEGELGSIGGSVLEYKEFKGSQQNFTNPDQAVDFVEQTDIDILAISFGNVHGIYQGDNQLDLDIIRKVYEKVDIPLVMHGGSGLADDIYPQVIDAGISKINYYTNIARKGAQSTLALCLEKGDEIIQHEIIADSIEFYYKESKRVLELFRAAGKA